MVWQVAAAFQVAGGFMSAGAKKKAGKAALREARMQAAEIRRQKFDVALLATQQHENRMDQFKDLVATNEAYAAFMNRSGRSLRALQKAEERKYGKDIDRIRLQESREKDKLEREAVATIERGYATSKAYKAAANATMFNAIASAATLSIPTTSNANTKTSNAPASDKASLISYGD